MYNGESIEAIPTPSPPNSLELISKDWYYDLTDTFSDLNYQPVNTLDKIQDLTQINKNIISYQLFTILDRYLYSLKAYNLQWLILIYITFVVVNIHYNN